jgi:signal peptide peptidase SppA
MQSYYYIPLYIFLGYFIGKLLSKKSEVNKKRFNLTNYKNIFINEFNNKNNKLKQINKICFLSYFNIFSQKKQDMNNNIENINKNIYLVYDFDQLNNKSKINTYINNTEENHGGSTFEDLSFFVSFVICNFDSSYTKILFRISSPGGAAYAFEKARDEIIRLKKNGFLITGFVDDICASGGYMLACACNTIICTETSKIGSIGVLTSYINFHEILEKIGITKKMIGTSEYKYIPNFTGEKYTEKHEELIKEELDYTLQMFLKIVLNARPNIDENLIKTAKMWYGYDALKNNLVDEINNIDDYILQLSLNINNEIYLVTQNNNKNKTMFSTFCNKIMKNYIM